MPVGKCGLCGTSGDLQDSHLLPKSVYKRLRKAIELDGHNNPNPVVVNADVTMASSNQVTDYFLCKACEQRFNSFGEKWIAENCWQPDNTFPLRDILKAAKPVHVQSDGLQFYEAGAIKELELEKIVYFAASVFWRAAAHEFTAVLGSKPQRLVLGPYEAELRNFLLGNSRFPKHAALVVTISSETDEGANELALFPFLRNKSPGATEYALVVPGVGFQLFVGSSIGNELAALCIATGARHLILLGSFERFLRDMWKLISRSKKKLI